jgi:very-short-patch-repair endonuclease
MGDEECISGSRGGKCTPRASGGALAEAAASGDRTIGEIAQRQHGVVARWQLNSSGIKVDAVEGRIARGVLLGVHQGVYAFGYRAATAEARWMAATLACGPDSVLSHRSAGQLWGIVPRTGAVPEVTRPGFFRQRPGILCHRSEVPLDEREQLLGIPVSSAARTQFDLAAVLTKRGLERAMHETEVRGLTDRLSLWDLLGRYPGRAGARNLRALLGAKMPAGITQSELEELFVAFLDAHGLPRPRLNATLPVRGRLLKPDCMWTGQRLLAELDGREVHGTDRAFEGDRWRDRVLLVEGWHSTRVTWRQLRDEPMELAADLRDLLGRSRT